MATPPRKPFNLQAEPKTETLRDKDNAALTPKAPSWAQRPAPNLAPPGMGGIKRGLPSPEAGQPKPPRTRFALGEKSKLARDFQPLAKPGKDRGHER